MHNHQKIIFGLKVKQLRTARSMSFADLALASGMSISYLNEIEKGKKYPKEDKIIILAAALETDAEALVSNKLSRQLAPIGELLRSQFLDDLHLEIYGIDTNKVIEMLADAPTQVGAFISTLMELSRSNSLQQEHFYFASLRSFQELHQNYFEDLEQKADECIEKFAFQAVLPSLKTENETIFTNKTAPTTQQLYEVLTNEYGYIFDTTTLATLPDLRTLRSYFAPDTRKLFLRDTLPPYQERFILAREIAYNFLNIKARNLASSPLEVKSFDQVLDNFRSAYFAVSLLLHREEMIADLRTFFAQRTWNPTAFEALIDKYEASPEMFFHRMTNLLPHYFGIQQLFFLRFAHKTTPNEYILTKELHLARLHHPHANNTREHYCRRWVSLSALADLRQAQNTKTEQKTIVAAQYSTYFGTQDQYLCFTIARPADTAPDTNVSVTIGIQVSAIALQRIKFMGDPSIPHHTVNQTCERCALENCAQRAAPPHIIEGTQYRKKAVEILKDLK